MKFWITMILGIVVVAAVYTFLSVGAPGLRKMPESSRPKKTQPPDLDVPKLVTEVTSKNLGKLVRGKGETSFEFRNDGKRELQVRVGQINCKCAGAKLYKQNMGPDESETFLRLLPGETGTCLVEWDSTDQFGDLKIDAELLTNDPSHKIITFSTQLLALPKVLISPKEVRFEFFPNEAETERTVSIFSVFDEDLQVSELTTSSEAFEVRLEPFAAEDLKNWRAKSGVNAVVRIDGHLPDGPFRHNLSFETNLSGDSREIVPLYGTIRGKFDVIPSRVMFTAVSSDSSHKMEVNIFAKELGKGDRLEIGEVTPQFLEISLQRNPEAKTLWNLFVKVPKGSPSGAFGGEILIRNQAGVDELVIPVEGFVTGPSSKKDEE